MSRIYEPFDGLLSQQRHQRLFSSAFQLFRPTGFVNPAPWSVLLRTVTPAKVKILAIEPIVNSSTIRMLDGILYAQDPYRR